MVPPNWYKSRSQFGSSAFSVIRIDTMRKISRSSSQASLPYSAFIQGLSFHGECNRDSSFDISAMYCPTDIWCNCGNVTCTTAQLSMS